jgi:hypothetical protein
MIVSKATSVYVIMVVVLFGGLWLILSMGSTLVPPTDLGGKWELSGPSGTQNLSVEQSGKFIDMSMGTWTASMKIDKDASQNIAGKNAILMKGNGQSVVFEGLGINDQCTVQFDGPMSGVYRAHRVVRAAR